MNCNSNSISKVPCKLFEISNTIKDCPLVATNNHSDSKRKVFAITTVIKSNDATKQSEECQMNNGSWTQEEHNRCLYAIKKYGNSWKKIEAYVGTRSRIQIRSHCQKYYDNLKSKAIMDAKKNNERKMFIVYQAYRNTTYDLKKANMIDYEMNIEEFKNKITKEESQPKPQEITEHDLSFPELDEFSELKASRLFQDMKPRNFNDQNDFIKINETVSIQEQNFIKLEEDIESELGLPNLASKREFHWSEDDIEHMGLSNFTRIKYDI